MNTSIKWMVAAGIAAIIGLTAYQQLAPTKGAMSQVSFTTIDHKKIDFADWQAQGKVTVVNFWATSCSTCKKEMPNMVKMYQELNPKGLEYVAIAMNYDNPEYIKNYVNEQQLPFNVTWDQEGRLATQFGGIMGTPTTFIIDKRGNVIKQYVGEPNWDDMYSVINKAIAA
ncbi:TlpA family protein disulfide reductase [Hydromonas duriensis]|uniref:Thiol-disulfide isomerase/thioredoxin n=1 Tax=Hydromonas duriensis TaxID=1527608 RepID=A0A4R6Y7F7_9BURK|nr:TlpA disulfide reductase family protein [Hydromonas duriensis]TDR31258.1 thiol-disulfide isomerase/thioredoxin [Hydromonas duriensis]